jgi:hypothetical protein
VRLQHQGGSFRDPASRVFIDGDRVFRALTAEGLEGWEALDASEVMRAPGVAEHVLPTTQVPDGEAELADPWVALLEHERLPFVSYPYEWPFGMLQDAARVQLDVLDAALAGGLILKDASPYNVQWRGGRPLFSDLGSFRALRPGEPWPGYRQFCMQFLYPLMLQAYRSVDFQPWLRGSLRGIEPEEMRRLLPRRDRVRRGVLTHVVLHARADRRARRQAATDVAADLRQAGFRPELIRANVARLRRLVDRLSWRPERSAWSHYHDDRPYTEAGHSEKAAFVAEVAAAGAWGLAWDLGANNGTYSRLVADRGAYVIAMDSDHAVTEALYRDLRETGEERILPLVMDLSAPSPNLGWREGERQSLLRRGAPDLVLCLALVHHLAIAESIPLPEIVAWLASLGASAVVEFATPEDPMVQRLQAAKPPEDRHEYSLAAWERCLEEAFVVERRRELADGRRVLFFVRPRQQRR